MRARGTAGKRDSYSPETAMLENLRPIRVRAGDGIPPAACPGRLKRFTHGNRVRLSQPDAHPFFSGAAYMFTRDYLTDISIG